jgi:lipid-binding SYLF domain-containing protein
MKKTMSLLAIGLMCMVGTYASAATARQDTVKRLHSSVDVLQAIMATPDKGIPEEVLSDAKCILVVPDLIKGGFIVGGKHGRGVASCRTAEGWSARPRSSRSAVGDCRSESRVWIWLCWS